MSVSVAVRASALKDTEAALESIKLSVDGSSGLNTGGLAFVD